MAGKIKKLKESQILPNGKPDVNLYPVTLTQAVYDGSGTALPDLLDAKENLSNKESVLTPTSTTKYPSSKAVADFVEEQKHPYLSLERLGNYLYRVTFDSLPEDYGIDSFVPAGCSSYVKDGKLYRNLDFKYDNSASFIVKTKDFEGMSFLTGLNDGEMVDDRIAQLPYCIVDGVNNYGIKVSTHILYNDWNWNSGGEIPLTRLPFEILSRVKSMDNIGTYLNGVLNNLNKPASMGGYLLQVLVTDGTTTYAILPPESSTGAYVLQNITSVPKLTNFRWVNRATVVRTEQDIQERPTGIERWNMMPCKLKDLRFTKAYETPDRLSEFIGIDETTKESTDAELTEIYNLARAEYLQRERDGKTWQTMHSVVYGKKMEELYVQEDWGRNCVSVVSGAVLYNENQNLEDVEKTQARKNIGAISSYGSPESTTSVVPYIAYTPQTLTDEQKEQARENIGSQNTISDLSTIRSGATAGATALPKVQAVEGKIPAQASSTNQLADKDFVNSSINASAAFYITSNASGDAFATKAALLAGPYYNGGVLRTPTKNDYAIVLADESKGNATTRYSYDGSVWAFQYKVNDTPLTAAQLAALNSGITEGKVAQIGEKEIAYVTTENTYEEVLGLKNAGKRVILNIENVYLVPMTRDEYGEDFAFEVVIRNVSILAYISQDDEWHVINTHLEQSSNKVTSINSSSTNEQYPSAKCVYDLVGNVESLLNSLL